SEEDAEDAIRLVDQVTSAYADKVILRERLMVASSVSDFRFCVDTLKKELTDDLKQLEEKKQSAKTASAIAEAGILQAACDAKMAVFKDLAKRALLLTFNEKAAQRAELTGGDRQDAVIVIQRATWAAE